MAGSLRSRRFRGEHLEEGEEEREKLWGRSKRARKSERKEKREGGMCWLTAASKLHKNRLACCTF